MTNLSGVFWLFGTLAPLIVLQRLLHREIQGFLLLLTRRVDITLAVFSLLFLPGVFLHESSHWLTAKVLGVRTGRFSIVPRPMTGGKLQLGFVETASTDWICDALIGAAPLVVGGVFVAFAALNRLGLGAAWQTLEQQGTFPVRDSLAYMYSQPDFWLWFYLIFVVSSTMLPSASDRRAWLPLLLIGGGLLGVSLLAGAGPWLMANLAVPLNQAFEAIAVVFGISAVVHLLLLLPVWMLRVFLSRLTGYDLGW